MMYSNYEDSMINRSIDIETKSRSAVCHRDAAQDPCEITLEQR